MEMTLIPTSIIRRGNLFYMQDFYDLELSNFNGAVFSTLQIEPLLFAVKIGKMKELKIFGNEYETVDGTGVRDYIHAVNLARVHINALKKYLTKKELMYITLELEKVIVYYKS